MRTRPGVRKHLAAVLLWILGAAAVTCMTNSAQAGCHYQESAKSTHFAGGTEGRHAEFYWWSDGPVQRVYEGGRFLYFQIPTGSLPCDGPHCKGSTPSESVRLVTTTPTQRITFDLALERRGTESVTRAERLVLVDCLQFCGPNLDGILRPPRPVCSFSAV